MTRRTTKKPAKRPFDPARVKETIKEIASGLNKGGNTCVRRVAQATAKLKTQIQRWRNNNPSQKEEPKEQSATKALSEVQSEIDETTESSKKLEDEFEDDAEGKTHRAKAENFWERLQDKIATANKPKKCGAEFDKLQAAFNAIVDEYSSLPAKLKAKGVKRVSFAFSDTDIGNTDLKDSKSLCKFAGRLVSQLKKAETNHKQRLAEARKLVCIKAGAVLKKKLISNLSNCLRKAYRDAKKSNNDSTKKEAADDADKFDKNSFQRVLKMLRLMKKKCLMKDTPESQPARVAGVFREKLKTTIRRKAGQLTEDDKKALAEKFNKAVADKYPNAINIETTITDSTSRRRLRPGRALAAAAEVETKWDSDEPSKTTDKVDVTLGNDFSSSEIEASADSNDRDIAVTETVTPIDTVLPDGEEETTEPAAKETTEPAAKGTTEPAAKETTKPVAKDATKPAGPSSVDTKDDAVTVDTGAKEIVFGAAAIICATLCVF